MKKQRQGPFVSMSPPTRPRVLQIVPKEFSACRSLHSTPTVREHCLIAAKFTWSFSQQESFMNLKIPHLVPDFFLLLFGDNCSSFILSAQITISSSLSVIGLVVAFLPCCTPEQRAAAYSTSSPGGGGWKGKLLSFLCIMFLLASQTGDCSLYNSRPLFTFPFSLSLARLSFLCLTVIVTCQPFCPSGVHGNSKIMKMLCNSKSLFWIAFSFSHVFIQQKPK